MATKWKDGIGKRQTRRGVVWDVRVYVGYPDQPYLNHTCKSESEAKKYKREQETRKDKGDRPAADKRTLAQYLGEWMKLKAEGAVSDRHMRKTAIGPRTLDDYRRLAEDWIIKPDDKKKGLRRLGHIRLDALTYHLLNGLYESMREFTTVGTIKKLNRFLGQAFVELEQKGVLGRNPADFTNVPQIDAKSRDADDNEDEDADLSAKAMEESEAQGFLKAARVLAEEQEREDDRQYPIPARSWSALFHVLLTAGLRPGEAFGLKWSDVVLDIGGINQVKVRRTLVRVRGVEGYRLERPKTKKSKRTVPIIPSAAKEVRAWRKMQLRQRLNAGAEWQTNDFIFTTSIGTPLHGARRAFERVSARAGLGEWGEKPQRVHPTGPLKAREFVPSFRLYDLRHSFATLLLSNGVPVNVVSDWMGHENPAFTYSRYGHALKKNEQEAVVKLESVLFKAG